MIGGVVEGVSIRGRSNVTEIGRATSNRLRSNVTEIGRGRVVNTL